MGRSAAKGNTMGNYTVLHRLKRALLPPGRVYTAHNTRTGHPALLVAGKPGEAGPTAGWRVRMETGTHSEGESAKARPFLAMEVLRAPECAHPGHEMADMTDWAAAALESVEGLPEVQRHLEGRASRLRRLWRTHARVRRPYLGALAGAVVAGVLALLAVPAVRPPAQPHGPPEATPVGVAERAVLEAPQALPVLTVDNRAPALALDMPRNPFPGQYRPDEDGKCKGRAETPLFGGCWVALKLAPPCGTDAYEWKGVCYLPSMPSAREKSSRAPSTPAPPAQRAR